MNVIAVASLDPVQLIRSPIDALKPPDLSMSTDHLPDPQLVLVYRLTAGIGQPLDLGDGPLGHQRIVPLTDGVFKGSEFSGTLVAGASADWQTVLPDGTVIGDVRYTLKTEAGDLLQVQSHGIRHGSPEVLGRLARGEEVDASEYTFRTSTKIEGAAPKFDWLNKGIFISVGARGRSGVIYDTYLVA